MRKLINSIDHGNNVVENHYDDGKIEWIKDGLVDREDGPAVIYLNGRQQWFKKGSFHRADGPAVENPDGGKFWYFNGKPHREDGPASEYAEGGEQWYIHGKKLSKQKIDAILLEKELNQDIGSKNKTEKKPKI